MLEGMLLGGGQSKSSRLHLWGRSFFRRQLQGRSCFLRGNIGLQSHVLDFLLLLDPNLGLVARVVARLIAWQQSACREKGGVTISNEQQSNLPSLPQVSVARSSAAISDRPACLTCSLLRKNTGMPSLSSKEGNGPWRLISTPKSEFLEKIHRIKIFYAQFIFICAVFNYNPAFPTKSANLGRTMHISLASSRDRADYHAHATILMRTSPRSNHE